MKRIISVLTAMVFFILAVPFYASAATITDTKSITDWTISMTNVEGGVAVCEDTSAYTGNAGVRMSSTQKLTGNIIITQAVPVENGKTYVYGFRAKTEKCTKSLCMINGTNRKSLIPFGNTWDWMPFEYTYSHTTVAATINFQFMIEGVNTLHIDDVYMYEYDVLNESRVGDNLIKNGGFESYQKSANDSSDGAAAPVTATQRTAEDMGITDPQEYTELGKRLSKEKHIPILPAKGIVIDGNSNEWGQYTRIPMVQYQQYHEGVPVSITGNYCYAWDTNYLYALFEFEDDVHHYGVGNYWDQDGMQFSVAGLGDGVGREFAFCLDADGASVVTGVTEGEIRLKAVREGSITRYEIAVPWNLKFDKAPSAAKFCAVVNDNDNDDYARKGCLETSLGISSGKTAAYAPIYHMVNENDTFCTWIDGKATIGSGNREQYNVCIMNLSDSVKTYSVKYGNTVESVAVEPNQAGSTAVFYSAENFGNHTVAAEVSCGAEVHETSFDIEIKVGAEEFLVWSEKMTANVAEIKSLINQCVEKGIPVDYARKNYFILSQYLNFLKTDYSIQDFDHMNNNMPILDRIYEESKANLLAYLSGEKEAHSVPRYTTGDIQIGNGGLSAEIIVDGKKEKRPIFLTGYGHFDFAQQYMKEFENMGLNYTQIGIKSSDVLKERIITNNWNYSVTNGFKADVNVVKDTVHGGDYAIRFTGIDGKGKGYVTFTQTIEVEPDTEYTYGLWAKGEGCDGIWFFANGVPVSGRKHFAGTSDWKQHTYTYKTDSQTSSITFMIMLQGIGSTVVDDLFVTKTGTDENLLINAGFEEGPGEETKGDYVIDYSSINALKKTLEKAEKNNVAVSLGLSCHNFPMYLYEKYPEIYEGGKFHKYLPFNPTHPVVAEFVKPFVAAVMEAVKDYDCIMDICIANEPQFQAWKSQYYTSIWQQYLKDLYGDIEELNKQYGGSYESFEEINMPKDLNDNPVCYDYFKFNREIVTGYLRMVAETVREVAPDLPISVKFMDPVQLFGSGELHYGADPVTANEYTDFHGCDAIDLLDEAQRNSMSKLLWYDFLYSTDPDLPVANTEDHTTRDTNTEFSPRIAKHAERSLWMGALHGRSMSVLWLWQRNKTSAFYGASVPYRPDVADEQMTVALDLNRLAEEVVAIRDKKPDVGLLYSESSQIATGHYASSYQKIYEALSYNGQRVRIVNEQQPEKMYDSDMLWITDAGNVLPETINNIETYIKNGGKVIVFGDESLKLDQYSHENDAKKVKYIIDHATFIPTDVSKTELVNPSGTALFEKVAEILSENGKERIKIVNAETGEREYGIGWLYSELDGRVLLSGSNWEYYTDKNVKIYLDGKEIKSAVDLRTDKVYNEVITFEACTPVLLELIK